MIRKLTIISAVFLMSSCAYKTVEVKDSQIQSHWIKQGEQAPFDGILLNDYTFKKMLEKVQNCRR